MDKTAQAFRTISEVSDDLDVPKHVLRFWEVKFPQIKPMKRGGGRRYYRPEDLELLRGIRHLLHAEAYTIKGVQKILREQGVDAVKRIARETGPDPSAAAATPAGTSQPPRSEAATGSLTGGSTRGLARRRSATTASTRPRAPQAPAGEAAAVGTDQLPATSREVIRQAIAELRACRETLTAVKRPQTRAEQRARARRGA